MSDNFPILSLIAFSPLLGIIALLFVRGSQGRAIKAIGIAAAFLPLVLSAWLYADFSQAASGLQYEEHYTWISVPLHKEVQGLSDLTSFYLNFDYHLAVDGLSLPLVFLTALVSAMAALASVYIKKRWKTYFIWFLLLEIGMLGVFMAQDLFEFFVFFELTLVPTYFLIGIWGYTDRERAANKFLLYNGLGSAVMLIAFLLIIATAGFSQTPSGDSAAIYFSGNITEIMHNLFDNPDSYVNYLDPNNPFYLDGGMKLTIFILLLIAFGIKLPILPFHTWMLKVHAEAPPSIVMIHSGILLKMGAYGLIRFGLLLFPEQANNCAVALAILGVVSILYGAVLAFVQKDFKLILAYSSISHMGVVLLGLAAINQIGLEGAVFQMVSHGLISALMFLLVGAIYERTQTTTIDELGGLAASVPFLSGILLVAGLASLGLPGLSGFISEFLAFLGLFGSMKVITVVGTLGIILTAVYVLRGVLRITFGPIRDAHRGMKDARLMEVIPMITLVAFILLIGIYPAILSQSLQQTIGGFDKFIQTIVTGTGG
ncbi:complex I subunit 4 family protein [Paenibacillus cymbidii]|uniref:complex I subunit 4 family protein n=1 Tax=Paenibacillus cymbidii TaxID=1639034 RepID=UPI00108225CB|nr:NADH-quinone oxidoreductase subunit M [Paenibacillus cymbidii]